MQTVPMTPNVEAPREPTCADKASVPQSFDAVARKYDLMQRLNPGYNKHLRMSAARLGAPRDGRILDLCCGTGLSTEAVVARYPLANVVGLDGSAGMLEVAREKVSLRRAEFLLGDATDPARAGVTGRFDGIFMAYGIRNVSDPDACLRNLLALLQPGAPIVFHEYSVADSRVSRAIWNAVAGAIIVPLGRALTGTDALFRYLRESVNEFDGIEAFGERLRRAGFVDVKVSPMDGWQRGVVHTIRARRPQ